MRAVRAYPHELHAVVVVRGHECERAAARSPERIDRPGAVQLQGVVVVKLVGRLECAVLVYPDQLHAVVRLRGGDGEHAAVAHVDRVDRVGPVQLQIAGVVERRDRPQGAVLVYSDQLHGAVRRRGHQCERGALAHPEHGHALGASKPVKPRRALPVDGNCGRRQHRHGAPVEVYARRSRQGPGAFQRVAQPVPDRRAAAAAPQDKGRVPRAPRAGGRVSRLHRVRKVEPARAAAARVRGAAGQIRQRSQLALPLRRALHAADRIAWQIHVSPQRGLALDDDGLVKRHRNVDDAARAVRAAGARRRDIHHRRRGPVYCNVPVAAERARVARGRQGQDGIRAALRIEADRCASLQGQGRGAGIVQVGRRVARPHRVVEHQGAGAGAARIRGAARRLGRKRQRRLAHDRDGCRELYCDADRIAALVRRVAVGRVDADDVRRGGRVNPYAAQAAEMPGASRQWQGRIDGIAGPVPQAACARPQRIRARIVQAGDLRVARLHRIGEGKRPRVVARLVRGRPVRAAEIEHQRRRRPRVHDGLAKVDDGRNPVSRRVRAVGQGRADAGHPAGCGRYADVRGRAERAGRSRKGQRQVCAVVGAVRQDAARRKDKRARPRVVQVVGKVARQHRVVEDERARPVAIQVRDRPVPSVQRND